MSKLHPFWYLVAPEWITEDFTTWTEVDPNNKLDQTSARASLTDLIRNEAAYLYKAKTINDFVARFDFQLSSIDVNTDTSWQFLFFLFVVCENYGRPGYVEVGQSIKVAVMEVGSSTTVFRLYLFDTEDIHQDETVNLDVGTTYYCTMTRVGDSVTLDVYSDSARTSLVDSISITLEPENDVTFNYEEVTASHDSLLDPNDQSDGYIENLKWAP